MRLVVLGVSVAALGLVARFGLGQPSPPPGYLTPATAPDTLKILPPAPKAGDADDEADQAIFRATRRLQGGARWALAQNDARDDAAAVLADFSCAAGVALDPAKAPKLAAVLVRMRADVHHAVDAPKDFYHRPRPYLEADGPICVDKTEALATSADYPSGHASWGWAVGLVLAELTPDRATQILARARVYGESRVVCGVHTPSAVVEGRTNGSIVVAALHGDPAFRADLEAARSELSALRKDAAAPAAQCRVEAELVAARPW